MPYKTITIFDLLERYLDARPMPQRIKYDMMQDGYEYFRWDDDAEEYICEGDPTVLLRCEVPWHHMMDEVEFGLKESEKQVYNEEDKDIYQKKEDEEEILKEQVQDFMGIVDETTKEQNRWGMAMMDALGEACQKEMENWSSEELEQAKKNLKESIDRAVEIGNQKHHVKKGTIDYHAKSDYGKAKLSLCPRRIIWDVAAIREYGNDKYPDGGPDNWRGVEVERYRDAAARHFLRYLDAPYSIDFESGYPHLWHLACNIAFLCEMEDRYLSKNPEVVKQLEESFNKIKEDK